LPFPFCLSYPFGPAWQSCPSFLSWQLFLVVLSILFCRRCCSAVQLCLS
jgi:hypothetical protein